MDAYALYKAGELEAAIGALGAELRKQPTDTKRRTFLFELLCFAGEYDRAEKHLDILADASKDAAAGTLLYRAALSAQRTREDMFRSGTQPQPAPQVHVSGAVNGTRFELLLDEDPRLGANLEVFIAGTYTWVPFQYIDRVELETPKRLRDLLWAPALLHTTSDFRLQDLGEVLLPVLAPGTAQASDPLVKLGRVSTWSEEGEGPLGQKLLLADDQPVPLLDIRELTFVHGESA